jgi:hypothetical protein
MTRDDAERLLRNFIDFHGSRPFADRLNDLERLAASAGDFESWIIRHVALSLACRSEQEAAGVGAPYIAHPVQGVQVPAFVPAVAGSRRSITMHVLAVIQPGGQRLHLVVRAQLDGTAADLSITGKDNWAAAHVARGRRTNAGRIETTQSIARPQRRPPAPRHPIVPRPLGLEPMRHYPR